MDDDNTDEDEETLKRKKIRKILLLKTDEELKLISKKKSNIMINSKTTGEINKSYNLYNILLSEKSKIYFNFVKTEEKIVSNNIRQLNTSRIKTSRKKIEKQKKLLSKSIEEESNSPILNFFPKKIDLCVKIIDMYKRSSKNDERKIEKHLSFEKTSNEEKINKSTKIEKRGLFKLVDKIVNIKMKEDIGEVKKSILKLRKLCNKLRKPKKKIKKLNKQKTQITLKYKENKEKSKEKCENKDERLNNRKRMTITDNKFLKRKSLFENQEKKNDSKIKRLAKHLGTTKNSNFNIMMDEQKEKEKNINKMTSTKVLKKINSIVNKDKNLEPLQNTKKKTLRKMQTLIGNMKNQLLKNSKLRKNSETTKNDESIPLSNKDSKNIHLLSSKFQRPTKYQFNNTNIKIVINKETTKSKFNPEDKSNNKIILSNNKIILSNRDKKEKEKEKEKEKLSINNNNIQFFISSDNSKDRKNSISKRKTKNYSLKIFDNLHCSKKDQKLKLEKSYNENRNLAILSEFKSKKTENNI